MIDNASRRKKKKMEKNDSQTSTSSHAFLTASALSAARSTWAFEGKNRSAESAGVPSTSATAAAAALATPRARAASTEELPAAVAAVANPFAVATTFAWCLILFSNIFFLVHLALMWLRWGCGGDSDAPPRKTGTPHDGVGHPEDAAAVSDSLVDPT